METNQIHLGNRSGAGANLSRSHVSRPAATLAWLAAVILILIGAAFQLGMLGFGPYNSSDLWLFPALGRNVWIAIVDLAGPQLINYLSAWPIVLVSFGSAILLIVRRRNRFDSNLSSGSPGRTSNAS